MGLWGRGGGQRRLHKLTPELNHNRCRAIGYIKERSIPVIRNRLVSNYVAMDCGDLDNISKDPDPVSSCVEIGLK